jgi:hypothetical protein
MTIEFHYGRGAKEAAATIREAMERDGRPEHEIRARLSGLVPEAPPPEEKPESTDEFCERMRREHAEWLAAGGLEAQRAADAAERRRRGPDVLVWGSR